MPRIAHVAVTTKDMELSLRFYTEALGFVKAFEIPKPDTGEPWINYLYASDSQFVELFFGGEKDGGWVPGARGVNHLCIGVDDIHAASKQVEAAGFAMDKQPSQGSDGNWQAWTTDPDGVRIELMQISPDSLQATFEKKYLAEHGK